MDVLIGFAIIVGYLGCSVLAWGLYHGNHKKSDYAWTDPRTWFSIVFCCFGPIALLSEVVICGFKGFSMQPITREERWEIYKQKYEVFASRTNINDFDKE